MAHGAARRWRGSPGAMGSVRSSSRCLGCRFLRGCWEAAWRCLALFRCEARAGALGGFAFKPVTPKRTHRAQVARLPRLPDEPAPAPAAAPGRGPKGGERKEREGAGGDAGGDAGGAGAKGEVYVSGLPYSATAESVRLLFQVRVPPPCPPGPLPHGRPLATRPAPFSRGRPP